jgi:hypothetical protein
LGESLSLRPQNEIEIAIDLGISETLEALKAQAIQEKIVPYLEALDLVGKGSEADAVRRLLELSPKDEGFFDRLDKALTSQVIRLINEAFHGKILVVERDLDRLYQCLVHRKYTLSQTRRIIEEWLEQETLPDDTFFHFIGQGEKESVDQTRVLFWEFLEGEFAQLAPLYRRIGHDQLVKAMLAALWAGQYDIPALEIIRLFPSIKRAMEQEDPRLPEMLTDLARTLRDKKPSLFESLVSHAEEDPGIMQTLWSILASTSPIEIFKRESIFAVILKESFERVIGGRPGEEELSQLLRASETVKGHQRFEERKEEMVDVLKTYRLFRGKGSNLKWPKDIGPEKYLLWEKAYVENISPLPALKEDLREALSRSGIRKLPFLKEEEKILAKTLEQLSEDFGDFYRESLPFWERGGGSRPMMIEDIPVMLSKKRKVPDHARLQYMLMDGMRWDLWETIKADFFGKRANLFRVVKEGAIWARQPTNTSSQLPLLEKAFLETGRNPGDDLLWKLSGIDEKIHSEKGPLTHMFRNVVSYLEIDWLHMLRRLPSRTLLILFSDHGFVENPAFDPSAKYESPRYTHGKVSPFEVIVPWAWLMRI